MAAPYGSGRSPLSPRPIIIFFIFILYTFMLINHSNTHTAHIHRTFITPRRATSTGFIFYIYPAAQVVFQYCTGPGVARRAAQWTAYLLDDTPVVTPHGPLGPGVAWIADLWTAYIWDDTFVATSYDTR